MTQEGFDPTRNGGGAAETSRFSAITPELAPSQSTGLDAEDVAAINALPASSALLIVLSGPNAGARFLLNSEETIAGRHPKSDIFLDDVTVSRKHAIFLRSGSDFYVQDAVSLNGTYVNRHLVEEAKLESGDEVRIGKYSLTFYASPQVVK